MYDGFHTDVIHSDQSQAARNAAVDGFRGGKTWVLIATDLMGEGKPVWALVAGRLGGA